MFKKILDLLNFPIPKTLNPNTCSLHYNPTQNERIFKLFQTLSPQSSRYVIADPSSVTRHLTRITEANKTGDDLERVGSVARIDLDRVRSGIGPDSCSSLSRPLSSPLFPVVPGLARTKTCCHRSLEGTRMHRRADEQHARADRHGNGERFLTGSLASVCVPPPRVPRPPTQPPAPPRTPCGLRWRH